MRVEYNYCLTQGNRVVLCVLEVVYAVNAPTQFSLLEIRYLICCT